MPLITIIAGSTSDRSVIDPALEILRKFNVTYDLKVVSAHRDPDRLRDLVRDAESNGTRIFIAAAGMAAHLAGVVASYTVRPVIGIPVGSGPLKGQDSLLSTAMMPPGIPVATVAIDGGKNAAWLALEILALLPDCAQIAKDLGEERVKNRASIIEAEQKWLDDIQAK